MATQLSFKLRRKGKIGRTVKGRIRKGYRLSACTGTMGKAKHKRRRAVKRRARGRQ